MLRPVLQLGTATDILVKKGMSADGIAFHVPAGYMLEYLLPSETGGEAITFDASTEGSSEGDILEEITVSANTTEEVLLSAYFSDTVTTPVYVNVAESKGWGSSVLDVYGLIRKVK
jgi:hypothetical protein